MFNQFRFDDSSSDAAAAAVASTEGPAEEAISVSKRKTATTVVQEVKQVKKAKKGPRRKWQERYHSICDECFEQVKECVHHPDQPLRLLIVGHNPSDHAWESGYSYSNPTNRFWKLLAGEFQQYTWNGVLPKDWTLFDQNRMPHVLGIGFSDLGHEPGNDAAIYKKKIMHEWKQEFYNRMRQHLNRVAAQLHGSSGAEKCSNPYAHGPLLVAFSGKRQYSFLFDPPLTDAIRNGKQDPSDLPPDWPLPPTCEVWVLPSSSGRAAMTHAQRCQPYMDLAERFHELSKQTPLPNVSCALHDN
ncbi:hypothetical protein LEN26_005939 [Aphanomyces euteiches]|nr:hypothetical protein AeMF1_009459 [Aphanomyces euteiches]KAH9137018.1 hypothetical protein LEN26_005939 [Aphanomyces euteiches]KAH9189179.1 hypothetical protein AeNC1_008845 [Aphanomyces euteiches]